MLERLMAKYKGYVRIMCERNSMVLFLTEKITRKVCGMIVKIKLVM